MSSIKNTTKMHHLNSIEQKGLKLQLNKLDLHNKLLLILNKKIEKFPHNKVNDKLGGSLNQNIIFNFSNKNANTDRRLKNNPSLDSNNAQFSLISGNPTGLKTAFKKSGQNAIKLLRSKVSDLGPVLVKTPSRLGIINNVEKILTSFFKGLYCLIGRPQFINKADKLIIKVNFYQNNTNKDTLLSNNKLNFVYNLFNGNAAAKAQYNAPKSQNFSAILRDMLGQTKWNKVAQRILTSNNNETINSLELANISKKVFMLFIKDLMNLTASKKGLYIEEALNLLQKGTPASLIGGNIKISGNNISNSFGTKKSTTTSAYNARNRLVSTESKRHNQLVMKLINSTNSEALSGKRTRLSKTFFNKSLLLKLTKKVNNHNNIISLITRSKNNIASKELIGKGVLMNPVTKAKLSNLLEWSPSNLDLSTEYKLISKALLLLLEAKINSPDNTKNASEEVILGNKIVKNLTDLCSQYTDELKSNTNYTSFGNSVQSLKNSPLQAKMFARFNGITKSVYNNDYINKALKGNNLGSLDYNNTITNLIFKNLSFYGTGINNKPMFNNNGTLAKIRESLIAYNILNNNTVGQNKNTILTPSGLDGNSNDVNAAKFKLLGILLAKIFQKNIDLQLVKMHNVGLDSEISSQVIALNARFDKTSTLLKKVWRKMNISKASLIHFQKQNKIINDSDLAYNSNLANEIVVPMFSKLINKTQIGVKPVDLISNQKQSITLAQLYDHTKNIQVLHSNPLALGKTVGLNIRIAGRLRADPIKPKQTVKSVSVGNFSKDRANTVSLSSFTTKNRKGTFRITVKMGHSRTFSTSTEIH